ncbi:adenylate kinase 2 protein [Artemisia annua]|uniref:adenylate kinase n=1 Tax=Artemisia annua TaxID=35608 RepID=A0A2U1L7J9_ARTAN|nr:adenylate kinase 2 protein [Artemisia annua]
MGKGLKIMISGAPASGKGTQCELITTKYDLVHVAAGDLLRAEVAAGSENGRLAKEYMEKGQLVPDEIVVMVWFHYLLNNFWICNFLPNLYTSCEQVPQEILVDRVVGRRLDPVTGKIYHLTYSPPETEEIAARLTQRFDDTEEKVKLRLQTHNKNVESVLAMFEDITVKVDGTLLKEEVFARIDSALSNLIEQKDATIGIAAA